MSQPIRDQSGLLVFWISQKNTNLVQGVVILLPVKLRWILFSGCRGEVENVSANQRQGRPYCFSDSPEKHKLGRRCWHLASWQVSFNSVQRFKRRIRNVSANQMPGRPYSLSDRPDLGTNFNTNLVEDIEILLPVKFRWIPFSVSEKTSKMSQQIAGQGGRLVFLIGLKNTNMVEDIKILLHI